MSVCYAEKSEVLLTMQKDLCEFGHILTEIVSFLTFIQFKMTKTFCHVWAKNVAEFEFQQPHLSHPVFPTFF